VPQRLVADVLAVARALLSRAAAEDAASAPPLLLVGHSMGGAVAARVAARGVLPTLAGVALLDIVEGTALAAAPAMAAALAARPQRFGDESAARAWARAPPGPSLPSQLVPAPGGGLAWRTPLLATQRFWEGWFRCAACVRGCCLAA
jgi:protein phosphatase methylesterase 1